MLRMTSLLSVDCFFMVASLNSELFLKLRHLRSKCLRSSLLGIPGVQLVTSRIKYFSELGICLRIGANFMSSASSSLAYRFIINLLTLEGSYGFDGLSVLHFNAGSKTHPNPPAAIGNPPTWFSFPPPVCFKFKSFRSLLISSLISFDIQTIYIREK